MAHIERFTVRNCGRDIKLVRRPQKAAPADLGSLKKADLVEMAEAQGIDASGTKADIAERLEAADE